MKKFITQNNIKALSFIKNYASAKRACVVFFCCLALLCSNSASAKSLLEAHKQDLAKIETYLNNIKNLSADFVQSSESGYAKGKFLLSRPGKMRVDYDDQPKILIVVNGSVLSYKDIELDEVSRLRTNTTPASFLTRKNISFSAKDVKLVDFKKSKEFISVAVVKKNRPEAGKFRLFFKREPFGFVKMEVEDEFSQKTSINLQNIAFPEKIKNNLFIIRNKNLPL